MTGTRRWLGRVGAGLIALAGLGLLAPAAARGQSLGLEAGWAGIENHDLVNAAFGLSLFAPLSDRWTGSLTYTQWTGQDGNYGGATPSFSYFYGNKGINATVLYRLFGADRFTGSVGGGVGFYDFFRGPEDNRAHTFSAAMTLSTRWRYGLTPSAGVYLRGDLSVRNVDLWNAPRPNWGFLRLGLEWSPWK